MKKYILGLSLCLLIISSGYAQPPVRDTVMQVSTIDALLAGAYDGSVLLTELLEQGDLGIGTFDRLEGEMIFLDGVFYQIKADGKVYRPGSDMTTPFAAVCGFAPDRRMTLPEGADYEGVKAIMDGGDLNKNIFWAVKITGTFRKIRTRSVPAQQKPYRPLAQVTQNQPEFPMEQVSGTLVGFRCPPFVKGINVPGYHLHFLSDDKTRGGHVLSFELVQGVAEVDLSNRFHLVLPVDSNHFNAIDLSKDRAGELDRVEK